MDWARGVRSAAPPHYRQSRPEVLHKYIPKSDKVGVPSKLKTRAVAATAQLQSGCDSPLCLRLTCAVPRAAATCLRYLSDRL